MPGYKTWAPADILTAADVNDYLMEQANIVCTSGTRPGSPHEGMSIYETDTDKIMVYNAGWKETGRANYADGAATIYGTWTATKNYVYRRGSFVFLQITFNRPAASMTGLTGYVIANMSSATYWPGAAYDFSANSNAGHTCTCTVDTAGDISVRPTTTVAAGTNIILNTMWPLA